MSAAIKIARCCVRCTECGDCYSHSLYELRDLINAISLEIADYAKAFAQKINQGYACFNLTQSEVDKLLILKESVVHYYESLRTKAMACLCDAELQKIKEKIGRIIDLRRCFNLGVTDIQYDYSQYDQWVAENPSCVAYDVWEKGLVKCLQPTFIISVKTEQRVRRTLYAISTRDTSGCVMKLLAYAYKAKCENRLVASATDTQKCNLELKALSTLHKCDMSLSVYSTLLKCNLSFNVISTILGCGGKFVLGDTGTPILKIGARSSIIDDVVKLAGGTWQNMNEAEFNEIYE